MCAHLWEIWENESWRVWKNWKLGENENLRGFGANNSLGVASINRVAWVKKYFNKKRERERRRLIPLGLVLWAKWAMSTRLYMFFSLKLGSQLRAQQCWTLAPWAFHSIESPTRHRAYTWAKPSQARKPPVRARLSARVLFSRGLKIWQAKPSLLSSTIPSWQRQKKFS